MKKLGFFILFIILYNVPKAQIITNFAGGGTSGLGDGGPATNAIIYDPGSGVFDNDGNYYISSAASGNTIRKINSMGVITTYAGIGIAGYNGDGILATTAKLNLPFGLAIDRSGNLFFADANNHRIRKVNKLTGIITTVVGNGTGSYGGDGGAATAAMIFDPQDICFDKKGSLYIADYYNYRVRKVDTSGVISTFAGNGVFGYSGDGGLADTSKIGGIVGLCMDTIGNLYIADGINTRVFKIDTFGIITTFAGTDAGYLYNGDGIPATAANINPNEIAFDDTGNLYIADGLDNFRVRKVTTSGIIYTVAGNGISGHSGDGGAATAAELNYPDGVAFDKCGNLYVPEAAGSGKVHKISFYPSCSLDSLDSVATLNVNNINVNAVITVYPNPATDKIIISASNIISQITIINMVGQVVYEQECRTKNLDLNIGNIPNGIYFMEVVDEEGNKTVRKIVKE